MTPGVLGFLAVTVTAASPSLLGRRVEQIHKTFPRRTNFHILNHILFAIHNFLYFSHIQHFYHVLFHLSHPRTPSPHPLCTLLYIHGEGNVNITLYLICVGQDSLGRQQESGASRGVYGHHLIGVNTPSPVSHVVIISRECRADTLR